MNRFDTYVGRALTTVLSGGGCRPTSHVFTLSHNIYIVWCSRLSRENASRIWRV